MGNWNISIQGLGAHHNGLPTDADQMAKAFVETLRQQGHHTIESATFTYGGREELRADTVFAPVPSTDYRMPDYLRGGPGKVQINWDDQGVSGIVRWVDANDPAAKLHTPLVTWSPETNWPPDHRWRFQACGT